MQHMLAGSDDEWDLPLAPRRELPARVRMQWDGLDTSPGCRGRHDDFEWDRLPTNTWSAQNKRSTTTRTVLQETQQTAKAERHRPLRAARVPTSDPDDTQVDEAPQRTTNILRACSAVGVAAVGGTAMGIGITVACRSLYV